MVDEDVHNEYSLDNSQELTLGVDPESPQSHDLACPLSLSLDDSQP